MMSDYYKISFGLCNAAQTLSRLMDKIIPHELHGNIFVYLDDLLITSSSLGDHFRLLELVSDKLKNAGLTINVEKSKFCIRETEYLGYIIGGGKLRANPSKISTIVDFPKPTTVRKLRRFLGMCSWYRRFISNFATIAAPLSDLLKKSKKFEWNSEADVAFNALKEALASAPVLVHPNFKEHFYIRCDASMYGIGGVLYQKGDSGEERPISFFSQKLNGAQKNYSITELECLAAVLSVKKFRAYVERFPFTIITDHQSLKWLRNQRDLSGRLARWSLKLQCYDFDIEHCSGAKNIVPDTLSRIYAVDQMSLGEILATFEPVDLDGKAFEEEGYQNWRKEIESCKDPVNLRVIEGKIFVNVGGDHLTPNDVPDWKLVVPESLRVGVIKNCHDPPEASHPGVSKTLEKIKRLFYWKGMSKDVLNYVRNCDSCRCSKPPNNQLRPPMGNMASSSRAFQRLYFDFLGPYPRSKRGCRYILVILDHYSKYVTLKPLRTATAQAIIDCFREQFHIFGIPETVVSDNGSQMEAIILKDFLEKYGVSHVFTPKYSPQSNASERVNQTILSAIRSYVKTSHTDWDKHLPEIAAALRNVKHESTGFTPNFLAFGQNHYQHASLYELSRKLTCIEPNYLRLESNADRLTAVQGQVLKNLRDAYLQSERRYNLRSRQRILKEGQVVFAKNFIQSNAAENISAKLSPKYIKAVVVERVGNVAYKLKSLSGKPLGLYQLKHIKA